MCMRIYYFWCYWPWSLVFFVRCVIYISHLRKIGQKLRSLSRTICIWDRHIFKWFYICPMPCVALDRQQQCTVKMQRMHSVIFSLELPSDQSYCMWHNSDKLQLTACIVNTKHTMKSVDICRLSITGFSQWRACDKWMISRDCYQLRCVHSNDIKATVVVLLVNCLLIQLYTDTQELKGLFTPQRYTTASSSSSSTAVTH